MNNIGMLTELELKDRLYTVRQQKRVLENRLEKYTFRCQIIANSRQEAHRQIRGGIVPTLFYAGFIAGMVLMLLYCIKVTLQGGSNGKQGGRIYVPYSNSGHLLWRKTDYPQTQEHADGILQLFHLEEGRGQSFFQNGGFVQGDRLRNGRNTGIE